MSRDARAKILSVYFRPWTLVARVATDTVPYLSRLKETPKASENGPQARSSIRKSWKAYCKQLLPHAKAQIQNFMLACLAEGKEHGEDDAEQGHRRGTRLYCALSVQEVREALGLQAKKAMQHLQR